MKIVNSCGPGGNEGRSSELLKEIKGFIKLHSAAGDKIVRDKWLAVIANQS